MYLKCLHCRSHGPSGGARFVERRQLLLPMAWQTVAQRSRMGDGMSRWQTGQTVPVGQQTETERRSLVSSSFSFLQNY